LIQKISAISFMESKKRYAIAGLSTRSLYHFVLPLLGLTSADAAGNDFSSTSEVVGIMDNDEERVRAFLNKVEKSIPYYGAEEITRMIQETGASVVLVGTPDYVHRDNIIAALEAGCDVVVEKPMVISADQARDVMEAERRTGRSVTVAFNYRYAPLNQAIKRLIVDGKIGRVISLEFTYNLDTFHGSSYFYRWNRARKFSGGLNVHKCCHHFDLVNWFLSDEPEEVFAHGKLNYYGASGALRPRDEAGKPYDPAKEKEKCPIFQTHYAGKFEPSRTAIRTGWDSYNLPTDVMYPPDERRYLYDDAIDIEDTYSVSARYKQGALLTYSCNFCTPWEGFRLGINGTAGRIEAESRTNPDPTGQSGPAEGIRRLALLGLWGGVEEITLPVPQGGHDGADPIIQRDLFEGISENSRELGLVAGSRQGGVAVAMGEAVWLSIRDQRPVKIGFPD
jgi:predicted dehydrogenase